MQIVSKPAPGLTAEQVRDARAHAWAFVFECHEKRRAVERALLDDRDDAKESNGRAATRNYTA